MNAQELLDKHENIRILTGNTYNHKETIRTKGGEWDAVCKRWLVPKEVFKELDELCNGKQNSNLKLKTQIWEECPRCGNEPIYLEVGVCEQCANRGRRA